MGGGGGKHSPSAATCVSFQCRITLLNLVEATQNVDHAAQRQGRKLSLVRRGRCHQRSGESAAYQPCVVHCCSGSRGKASAASKCHHHLADPSRCTTAPMHHICKCEEKFSKSRAKDSWDRAALPQSSANRSMKMGCMAPLLLGRLRRPSTRREAGSLDTVRGRPGLAKSQQDVRDVSIR